MRYRFAQRISYKTPGTLYGTLGDVQNDWSGEKNTAYAVVFPGEDGMAASPLGLNQESAYRLLLDRDCALRLGDGVWLSGAGATPDAVVMAIRRHTTHVEATVMRVIADG